MKKNLVRNLFSIIFVVYLLVVPVLSFALGPTPDTIVDDSMTTPPATGVDDSVTDSPTNKIVDDSITTPPANVTKLVNPIKVDNINDFIKILLQGVLKIGMPIIALAIIYCGFLFVQARGKPDEITKAKDALTWTLVGAAILLGSWAIAELIANTVLTL